MNRSLLATALIASLAIVATTVRSEEKPAGNEDKELAPDLALLQGSWELIHGKDAKGTPNTRSVKTIEGNKETLRRYNLQTGQLRVEHTSEFKLTKSGAVRVFTFYEVGDSAKNGYSYVYSVDKENFYDVPGLLRGDEYQNYQTQPGIWHWQRLPDNDFNRAANKAETKPLDPTDANAITARLQRILPKDWRIVRTVRDSHPSNRPAGKGIAVFLAPPELRQKKTDYEAAVYVMPPDYDDGGRDPSGGKAQSWPAQLVGANDRMKIYVWGGWNGGRDLKMEEQVKDALLK